jgi:hypothetical protein
MISACSKEADIAALNVSYKMIADKSWLLEYSQINNGGTITTKSYVGQSTYFIQYHSNLTTLDSDGIEGVYTIQNQNKKLNLKVIGKTASGNNSNYEYEIESLGAKNMILSYQVGTTKTILYFSTQHSSL